MAAPTLLVERPVKKIESTPAKPWASPVAPPVVATPFDAVGVFTAFLALLLLVPARWVLPGMGAAGRPANIFAIGMLVLWLVIKYLPQFETTKTPLRWPLLINALAIGTSYALAFDRGLPGKESLSADRALMDLLAISGIVLLASEGIRNADQLNRITKRLTYFTTFIVVVGLVQFFLRFDLYSLIRFPGLRLNGELTTLTARGAGDLVRVKGSFLHPIEFAVVMALMLPITLHHAFHEANATVRRRRFAIAAIHAGAGLLAVSRTAVVTPVVAMIVLYFAWSGRMRIRSAIYGFFFLALMRIAIPGLLGTLRSLFVNWNRDTSISGRTDDYEIVTEYIAERPFFGRGVGTFIPSEYIVLDNAYLGHLVTTGWIGLLALGAVVATAYCMCRRAAVTHPQPAIRHLAIALSATIAVSAAAGALFDLFYFPGATGIMMLAVGCAGVVYQTRPGDSDLALYAPNNLLKRRYRLDYTPRPWWHRFDPDFRQVSPPLQLAPPRSREKKVAEKSAPPQVRSVAMLPLETDRERQPYIALLKDSLDRVSDGELEFRRFSAKSSILNRPDVIHIHWPEHALASGFKNRLRAMSIIATIRWSRRRGSRLVYTAHNVTGHDMTRSNFAKRFMQSFDQMVDDVIVMSRAGYHELVAARPGLRAARAHHIRHGDFSALAPYLPYRAMAKARLGLVPATPLIVFAGQVRPYKGVPELLDAAVGLDANVLIAGKCSDPELRKDLETRAANDPRIHLRLKFHSNEDLAQIVRAADLVALPYRNVFNSGSALLALSVRRRVLVPATPTFTELASEIGDIWVLTYDEPTLSSETLDNALHMWEESSPPDLSNYGWDDVASATTEIYKDPVASAIRNILTEPSLIQTNKGMK